MDLVSLLFRAFNNSWASVRYRSYHPIQVVLSGACVSADSNL